MGEILKNFSNIHAFRLSIFNGFLFMEPILREIVRLRANGNLATNRMAKKFIVSLSLAESEERAGVSRLD